MKVCIVVGHAKTSPGAENKEAKITEFKFNNELAKQIKLRNRSNVDIEIVYRDTYMELPYKINQLNPDFIISLHCNAFNEQTSGTEVLYWHKTKKSNILALLLQQNLVKALNLTSRGIKPRGNKNRGARVLRDTNAPCVISEPFFIDNTTDLNTALSNYDALVDAYVISIIAYAGSINKGMHQKPTTSQQFKNDKLYNENNVLKDFIRKEYGPLFWSTSVSGVKGINKAIRIESIKKAKELVK